jgi:hypothetical protein
MRDLDVLVAKHAFKYDVVGEAPAEIDRESSVYWHIDTYAASELPLQPVYVAHCLCNLGAAGPVQFEYFNTDPEDPLYAEDRRVVDEENARMREEFDRFKAKYGHSRECLAVVPEYSSRIELTELVWSVIPEDLGWSARRSRGCFEAHVGGSSWRRGNTLAEAICVMALDHYGGIPEGCYWAAGVGIVNVSEVRHD